MRRFSPIVIAFVAAAALSAAAIMGWAIPPRPEKALSTDGSPARLTGEAAPSGSTAGSGPGPEESISISPERIAAEDIKVAPVKKGVLTRSLTVPGIITLNTDLVSRVPARVQGTVTEMRKRLGDSVAKGEVVAVLDSREVADAKSEYLTASVAYDLKKTLFERAQALWNKRISAEQQYLQAREAFLQAQLRLDLARQKLSALNLDPADVERAERHEAASGSGVSSLREYQIRSLSSGRVIERKVDVGSLVGSQGDPSDLYTVADLTTVWIELSVPTADLDLVEEGQPLSITSGSGGRTGKGRIKFVSPLINPETRAARIIGELDNESLAWRPGAAVTASIQIQTEAVAVSVPREALQTIGGEQAVFVRTPDGFQKRKVVTGRSDGEAVEIISGLSAGEEIAITNTFLLKAELGKGSIVSE